MLRFFTPRVTWHWWGDWRGRLLYAKYHPHRCSGLCGPQLESFGKFWNLIVPHWRISCTIFTKFSRIVGFFVLNYVLKFREIWSRGSRVPGLKICGSLVTPKYWAPLRGETVCWTPKRFAVLYHHAKFGGARTLHATRGAKNVDVLSVCLSVMLLNGKVSEHWRS